MKLSNLSSTFAPSRHTQHLKTWKSDTYICTTSLSETSGQRDISLREVATDSFREEALNAINAVACLDRQLLTLGNPMIYYSIPEVAKERLKVSRSTVYRLVESGDLQLVHFRTCARITGSSLDAYCARRGNVGA